MMSEEEAIDRARQVAEQEGWVWVDPSDATLRLAWFGKGGKWTIFSNARARGAKARIVIDALTGDVLEKGYVPR